MKMLLLVLLLFSLPALAQWEYFSINCNQANTGFVTTTQNQITTNFQGLAISYDDDISSVQNIGFPFHYNGQVFTQFTISTNGFIKLGNLPPSPTNFDMLQSPDSNIIAAFNTDLEGSTMSGVLPKIYVYFYSGPIGNNGTTIQFGGFRDKSLNNRQFDNINFQIILAQQESKIQVRYGNLITSGNPPDQVPICIGIKGSDAMSSVNVVKSLSDPWSAATFADGPFGGWFGMDNSILPDRGRTFVFNQNSVVPLTLQSFTGKAQEQSNLLEWTTSEEINTRQFVIQRSVDGSSFDNIGSVMAAGVSHELRQYSFIDHDPLPLGFYRLRMIDHDGQYTYSAIIRITNHLYNQLQVYPNPVKESFWLKLHSNKNEPADLKIYSAAGMLIEKRRWSLVRGYNTFKIDGSRLTRGTYIIVIEAVGQIVKQEIIKM